MEVVVLVLFLILVMVLVAMMMFLIRVLLTMAVVKFVPCTGETVRCKFYNKQQVLMESIVVLV
jgi:hypothetical protein